MKELSQSVLLKAETIDAKDNFYATGEGFEDETAVYPEEGPVLSSTGRQRRPTALIRAAWAFLLG
jgi:hypothetical protein